MSKQETFAGLEANKSRIRNKKLESHSLFKPQNYDTPTSSLPKNIQRTFNVTPDLGFSTRALAKKMSQEFSRHSSSSPIPPPVYVEVSDQQDNSSSSTDSDQSTSL